MTWRVDGLGRSSRTGGSVRRTPGSCVVGTTSVSLTEVLGGSEAVEGVVVARRRKCRLIVAVNLIQQGVSIEIDDHLLEPLS